MATCLHLAGRYLHVEVTGASGDSGITRSDVFSPFYGPPTGPCSVTYWWVFLYRVLMTEHNRLPFCVLSHDLQGIRVANGFSSGCGFLSAPYSCSYHWSGSFLLNHHAPCKGVGLFERLYCSFHVVSEFFFALHPASLLTQKTGGEQMQAE